MEIILNPKYEDIFGKNENVNIESLIQGIPTKSIVKMVSVTSASLMYRENDMDVQTSLVWYWLSKVSLETQLYIRKEINEIAYKYNKMISVFNNIGCLSLIQEAIKNSNDLPLKDLTDKEQINLFKAYLLTLEDMNEYLSNNIDKEVNDISNINKSKFLSISLPSMIPQSDFLESKDFVSQTIKAISFFKYGESNYEYRSYLKLFLEKNSSNSWQEYLKNIWSLYIPLVRNNKNQLNINNIKSIIRFKESARVAINFISSIVINNNEKNVSSRMKKCTKYQLRDFKMIREKPVYFMGNNLYAIMNFNFYLDKIFHSVLFLFLNVVKEMGKKEKDFKSKYSKSFMEKEIFHNTIEYCFFGDKYFLKKGDEEKGEEYSDFYIRNSNKIILFEFKDRIMDASVKHSHDISLIRSDIMDKFVKKAGVVQLVKVIEKLSKGGYNFDYLKSLRNIDFNEIQIYPIIVYTDFVYCTEGINYIVNEEFKKQLSKLNITFKVKELIMLDFDILVRFQEHFHDNDVELTKIINKFITRKKSYIKKLDYLNMFKDFSIFLQEILRNKYPVTKIPKVLDKEVRDILPN